MCTFLLNKSLQLFLYRNMASKIKVLVRFTNDNSTAIVDTAMIQEYDRKRVKEGSIIQVTWEGLLWRAQVVAIKECWKKCHFDALKKEEDELIEAINKKSKLKNEAIMNEKKRALEKERKGKKGALGRKKVCAEEVQSLVPIGDPVVCSSDSPLTTVNSNDNTCGLNDHLSVPPAAEVQNTVETSRPTVKKRLDFNVTTPEANIVPDMLPLVSTEVSTIGSDMMTALLAWATPEAVASLDRLTEILKGKVLPPFQGLPVLCSTSPAQERMMELCVGTGVMIKPTKKNAAIIKANDSPSKLVRELLVAIIPPDELREMTSTGSGNSSSGKEVPQNVRDAIEVYVSKKCTRQLSHVRFNEVITRKCQYYKRAEKRRAGEYAPAAKPKSVTGIKKKVDECAEVTTLSDEEETNSFVPELEDNQLDELEDLDSLDDAALNDFDML